MSFLKFWPARSGFSSRSSCVDGSHTREGKLRSHYEANELPQQHGVVFPNPRSADNIIPDSKIRRMMQRAGIETSPLGFRSTFRTWAQERGENWETAEITLSHQMGGFVVTSHARPGMLTLRRDLMER